MMVSINLKVEYDRGKASGQISFNSLMTGVDKQTAELYNEFVLNCLTFSVDFGKEMDRKTIQTI